MIQDVNKLAGKKFISSRNNIGICSIIGEGGLYVGWKSKPTEKDIEEFDTWMKKLLDNPEITVFIAGKKSEGALDKGKEAYKEWRKKVEND
jgi:glycosyltransferase involved in cell wall biosynthesis